MEGLGVDSEADALFVGGPREGGAREADEVLLAAAGTSWVAGGVDVGVPIIARGGARGTGMNQKAVETDASGMAIGARGKVGEDVGESGSVSTLGARESASKAFVGSAFSVGLPNGRIGGEDGLHSRAERRHWDGVPFCVGRRLADGGFLLNRG